jgi:hypothetical protein
MFLVLHVSKRVHSGITIPDKDFNYKITMDFSWSILPQKLPLPSATITLICHYDLAKDTTCHRAPSDTAFPKARSN